MRYKTHSNYHRRKKLIRRLLLILVIAGLTAIYFGGKYIIHTYLQEETQVTETPVETVGYFEPSTAIFRSSFFQFQASKSWTQDINASTADKFIYRSYNGPLIEHEMTIYINNIPDDLVVTRVLPVMLTDASQGLVLGPVSDYCGKKLLDKKRLIQQTTVDGVKLNCNVDDNNYTILVGEVGGTTTLELARPGNTKANYAIFYRNVTASPNSVEIEQLLKTFQTR